MDPFVNEWVPIFLIGHLLVHEQNPLRKYLLYLLARYGEIPFLRFGYRATRGPWKTLSENPVLRALTKNLIVYPVGRFIDTGHPMLTEHVLELIDRQATVIAVGPCRCRVAHGQCNHRLETDIVIRTGTHAFTKAFPHDYRTIEKQEAKEIVNACAADGMWHMVFVHCPTAEGVNEYAVCNCCSDGCVPFILNKTFGQEGFPLIRGEYVAETIDGACRACGDCLTVCPWEARTIVDNRVTVDLEKCFGCGLCAKACANGGVVMRKQRPRPPLETDHPHRH